MLKGKLSNNLEIRLINIPYFLLFLVEGGTFEAFFYFFIHIIMFIWSRIIYNTDLIFFFFTLTRIRPTKLGREIFKEKLHAK